MKYKALIFSASIFLASCGSSNKATTEAEEKSQSAYAANIVVDGHMDDWQAVPKTTSPKGSVEFACANSKDNLYVLFKIADPAEQTKLIQGGMEVWFDPTGKHQKTTEVIYPVKGELNAESYHPALGQDAKTMLREMHRHVESQLISLNRIGFKPEYTGVQSIRENTGFKGAINWDENNDLVYELVVPFSAFPTVVNKDHVEIGFFIGAVDRPKNPDTNRPPASEEGGERGMGRGGMSGGGGRGGYGGRGANGGKQATPTDWESIYKPESFWVHYTAQ